MTTPPSSIAWVISGSFVGSFGALFLKTGANRLQKSIKALLTNWRLGVGVFFYLLSSVMYVKGTKQGELSVLYPMVSFGSVFTLFWSKVFLNEPLTRTKFLAVGMILVGITLLGLGNS